MSFVTVNGGYKANTGGLYCLFLFFYTSLWSSSYSPIVLFDIIATYATQHKIGYLILFVASCIPWDRRLAEW